MPWSGKQFGTLNCVPAGWPPEASKISKSWPPEAARSEGCGRFTGHVQSCQWLSAVLCGHVKHVILQLHTQCLTSLMPSFSFSETFLWSFSANMARGKPWAEPKSSEDPTPLCLRRLNTENSQSVQREDCTSVCVCVCVFCSACAPRPLAHSLTYSLALGSLAEIAT